MDEIFEVEFEDVAIVEPVIEPLSITENGRYEAGGIVDGYSPIDVDIQPTIEELNITDNGVYNAPEGVHGFNPVTVDVQPPLEELNATFNGEFLPSENNYGFSKVTVDVPIPGQVEFKDVNFIDYDGTLLYSYTANEFLALTQMPLNPEHDRLIAQGWNWTLESAKQYVQAHQTLLIGQVYDTATGATEIDTELYEGRLSPMLTFVLNGTAQVNFGDGSAVEEISGTHTSVSLQHNYLSAGSYTISILPSSTSEIKFMGTSSGGDVGSGSRLLCNSTINSDTLNGVYRLGIKEIRVGSVGSNNIINEYAFSKCYGLEKISFPKNVIQFASNSFTDCGKLFAIVLPSLISQLQSNCFSFAKNLSKISFSESVQAQNFTFGTGVFSYTGIKTIPSFNIQSYPQNFTTSSYEMFKIEISELTRVFGTACFSNCYSLTSIIIPSSCEQIYSNAFYGCYSLANIRFKSIIPPTLSNSTVFYGLPTDCKIYVPRGSLEAYTTATNYPSSATYQYIEY